MPSATDLPPDERRKLAFERLEKSTDEELFDVRWIDAPIPSKARIFKSVLCAQCGENVSEARARVRDGAFVCPECYGEVYSRAVGNSNRPLEDYKEFHVRVSRVD